MMLRYMMGVHRDGESDNEAGKGQNVAAALRMISSPIQCQL